MGGDALLEPLLAEGEATVTSNEHRRTVAALFDRSRALARKRLREQYDGQGVFDALPLAKEFVLLLHPTAALSGAGSRGSTFAFGGGTKRLYAEIRERHLRLATARAMCLA